MRIGSRTIKTAIGATISIWLAQLLGLTNFMTAGILTILSIQPSRKRSFISAWQRFIACFIAIGFASALFPILGYYPIVIGLLLLIFIPMIVYLKMNEGIITSIVIILNLYTSQNITLKFIGEQFVVIGIGISIALLLNLYMPSLDERLKEKQNMLDQKHEKILKEISLFIREQNMTWNGVELLQAEKILAEASRLVMIDRENRFLKNDYIFDDYFSMREKQFRTMQKMLPMVTRIHVVENVSEEIANFFDQLAEKIEFNHATETLQKLEELREYFKNKQLPKTRKEFETRASLFQLLYEIEEYLLIQSHFEEKSKNKKKI